MGMGQSLPGSASLLGQPGSASSPGQVKEGEDEDVVTLLDADKATEFAYFDPMVTDDSTWEARDIINNYLEKNFIWEMSDTEHNEGLPKACLQGVDCPKAG